MNLSQLLNAFENLNPNPDTFGRPGWPCDVQETWLAADCYGPRDGDLKGFPQRGRGDRCLFCDQYDNCLTVAANKDWEGFDCQRCSYPGKTALNFFFDEFGLIEEAEEEDDGLLHCSEGQMDHLLFSSCNRQEDILINLISSLEV